MVYFYALLILKRGPIDIDPFTHIYIASRLFNDVIDKIDERFPEGEKKIERLKGCFYSGSIMPDIGNYPGGEKEISNLSHNLRTWDLADKLIESSKDKCELAFSYGWALHIITDIIGHPKFTNVTQAEICGLADSNPQGVEAYDYPLEHKKTEFGAAAYLLGLEQNIFLWDVPLSFPDYLEHGENDSFLEHAFMEIYAFKPAKGKLKAGIKGIRKEMKRIPVAMKLLGSVKGKWYEFIDKIIALALNSIFVPIYVPFLMRKGRDGAIAVIKPFRMRQAHIERLNSVNEEIIRFYRENFKDNFSAMQNSNLDTGKSPIKGNSKHADNLMEEIKEKNIESDFRKLYQNRAEEFVEKWKSFESKFNSGR